MSPPRIKETHFFDDETQDWSAPSYSALDTFFSEDDGDRIRFDATPIYCFWPPALERIRAYNPEAKLIFLFRDPFERAWSQWCMEYARGWERLPFASAIREGRERMRAVAPLAPERRVQTYVERGFYAEQIKRAAALFPRRQMLLLRSSDLQNDHVATLRRIGDFLGISPFLDTGAKRENARPNIAYPSAPTLADLDLFCANLGDDMVEFAMTAGLDVSEWATAQRLSALATDARERFVAFVGEKLPQTQEGRLIEGGPMSKDAVLPAA